MNPLEPPLRPVHWIEPQAGVLAWLPGSAPLRFVIVTSRRTGRWVFPKGGVDQGMTPSEAARQEALEEAGVLGLIDAEPLGRYRVAKIRPPLIWTVDVSLYAMEIEEVMDVWIEAGQRQRRFVTLDEAKTLMEEPQMLALARRLVDRHADGTLSAARD